ncbi:hypothetical protein GOBAR_DD08848 [Gossypium barbadense]|nr:hypothetical protein GOBAR_DD08848 [Gossypium barbadense]
MAIGHVRYSIAGSSMLKNVQPFVVGYKFGSIGVAHNGNLVNYRALRAMLEDNAYEKLEGAYSMVFLTEDKLVAVRGPMDLGLWSVYESRHALGEILATEAPIDYDVVIAVSNSGVEAE